jgi:hypothetical protein
MAVTKKTVSKKRVPVKRAPRKPAKPKKLPPPPVVPLMMYRKIAISFVIVVAIILIAVLYLSSVQAVIKVEPIQRAVSSDLIIRAVQTPTKNTEVRGVIKIGSIGKTKTFSGVGVAAKEVEGISTGEVTITNNLSSKQPLVKTTRLLTPSGVLFRLTDGVTVPAKGSITAQVYADQKGKSGDIGASTFTIPGLNATKQKLVYAESVAPFTGGVEKISVVTKGELDVSAGFLKEELLEDAKLMLRKEAGSSFDGEVFQEVVDEVTFSIEPDTEANNYDVQMKITVNGVFFDQEALQAVVVKNLYEGLGQGEEFVSVDPDKITISVDQIDNQNAGLHVTLESSVITSRTSKALDVSRFVGLNEQEVKDLLLVDNIATSVEVDFSPFWVSKVPRLKDHIYIELR